MDSEGDLALVVDGVPILGRNDHEWRNIKGPEGSIIMNVHAKGDCWLLALWAQILGFVPDVEDSLGIVRTLRRISVWKDYCHPAARRWRRAVWYQTPTVRQGYR